MQTSAENERLVGGDNFVCPLFFFELEAEGEVGEMGELGEVGKEG